MRRASTFTLLCAILLAGLDHARAAETVLAWGASSAQQCQVPPGLGAVVAVAGGEGHSLALSADGTVSAWGANGSGQATVPEGLNGVAAVAAGGAYSMALEDDGTVTVWGDQSPAPGGLSNVVAIAAGRNHALALKGDGTVVAWGSQTNVPPGLTNVIAIAAGDGQSLALLADGEVVGWGDNEYAKALVPPGLNNVRAVAAGWDHCLTLLRDGHVVAWGRNDFNQATVPKDLSNVVAIAAGALHSLALKADGTVVAWGDDAYGQGSVNPEAVSVQAISAGAYHNLAIKGDNTPFVVSQPRSQTVFVSSCVTLSVSAIGAEPLGCQWKHDGNMIAGATNSVLTLWNVQFADQGSYSVTVTNALGAATSKPAQLTVLGGIIDKAPEDATVACGDSARFSIGARGPAAFNYQWRFADQDIPGATQSSLTITNATPSQSGSYSVIVSNALAVMTAQAALTVIVEPPHIISPLIVSTAIQGQLLSYTIQALHSPVSYGAQYLPEGLVLNPTNGSLFGIPLESGTFFTLVTVSNACASDTEMLTLTIAPGIPRVTGPSRVTGIAGTAITGQVGATGTPSAFGGQELPPGVEVNPATGQIGGVPLYAGNWQSTLWASNQWGVGQGGVLFSVTSAVVTNLSIENVTYSYSSPYLLDFQFSLYTMADTNDPASGHGVVVDPRLLSARCLEDDVPTSPSETGAFISRGSGKVIKTYLVLDFTESIASMANGDADGNGRSDAVDNMVGGAVYFVNQQPAGSQMGVYEFHRDDQDPSQVEGLTTDKHLLASAIGGIWTNEVQGFPAGSRCWDAVMAAINDLGPSNRDEQHYVVLVSDGRDESSSNTLDSVLSAATNNGVKVFCVGFGAELNTNTLQILSGQTQGKYHTASNAADLASQFARMSEDSGAQYILRWATLKRGANPPSFMPSFQISYQGVTADSPTNPWYADTNNPIVDTNSTPPTTNYNFITNFIIGYFFPQSNAAPVSVGSLRLAPDSQVKPTGITLRATYVPRYIRQLRLHYRANWPCTASLRSLLPGEMLSGWSMSDSDDGTGGKWLVLSSPNPADVGTSIPFASFGNLVTFTFNDIVNPSNAFSLFEVDNTIYTNSGNQSFEFENADSFVQEFPVLPLGTPVPWLISAGYPTSNSWASAELLDPDGDGIPNWQEYRANTDPHDSTSRFYVANVSRGSDGRFQVEFSSALNRRYRVETSQDLVTWSVVQDNIPGIGQELTVTDARGVLFEGTSFYRVLVY